MRSRLPEDESPRPPGDGLEASRPRPGLGGEVTTAARQELGDLFDSNHRVLFRVAMRVLGDEAEAEDVVQESFLRAASRLDRIPASPSGAQAWLVCVAVNLCRDRQRRSGTRGRWERSELDAAASVASRDVGAGSGPTEARLTVDALLARLPTRRRAVLVLRELEGWSVEEIAESLGLRRVTVRWHLAAARRDLARWLDAGGGSESSTTGGER